MYRKRAFNTLAEAKKLAKEYASADDAPVRVYCFRGEYGLKFEGEMMPYNVKVVYTANPKLITIQLTPEEAKHYQEYIETEHMVGDGIEAHFEGGMYKTEVETNLLTKLKNLIGI